MATAVVLEPMTASDWADVRAIYLDGVAGGQATFETDAPRWDRWDAAHHAFARLVARRDGRVVGWAALAPASRRPCYAGVAEVSVYVAAGERGRGVGRRLLEAVVRESERHGVWTLQGSTFPENEASLRLQRGCGFREVGRRERVAQLHGEWRDTVLTERRSPVVGAGGRGGKVDVPFASDAEVVGMVAEFEACRWPYPRWTHRAHLGVALCYLRRYPFEEALERARHHIRLYNRTRGDPTGYHETVTVLFMRRVDRYLRDRPAGVGLAAAVEELAAACDMSWVLRYYSPARLWSEAARAGWVEPDREPLDF